MNQGSPRWSIPTPQQNFVPSTTAQAMQISSHVPTNGLPPDGPLTQMAGVPPQQSTQLAQPPSQQPIQPHKTPSLPEDRFKDDVMQSTATTSSQIASRAPQPQAQSHQPTEADYQALLTSISSESLVITPEAMSILPRFSHTSGAELEAHRVPQHVIAFVEQNREQLQRAAQDQSGFRAGIRSTKNAPLDHRAQVNEVSDLRTMAQPPQVIPGYQNPPERLHPTLSSWIKNMNKLSGLIDRLEELARAAPSDCRPQLYRQIATLRMTFKSQQERCIHFLQLTEEYADRYLLDISAEIQQQSSFLDILEIRLDRAKTLYRQAIDLRKSYEAETVNVMNNARKTGKAAFFPCLERSGTDSVDLSTIAAATCRLRLV